MYFITTKRMLEVCFTAHPNIQYRTVKKLPHQLILADAATIIIQLMKSLPIQ